MKSTMIPVISHILLLFLLVIFEIMPTALIAQLTPNQNPPGIKWKKIQSDHFDVIVPEELTEEGQRVANTLEYLRDPLQKSLDVRMRRWQVLLSNRGAISNGHVTLFPRHSEWFTTPPQSDFSGTGEWYRLLAVHEGRHMAQFDKLNQGFTRFAGIFFGELGQGAFSFLATPLWLMEGDAVAMETALSNTGRGRMPQFDMGMRTLQLSGQQYSYYKAYLGSYKDYYPNIYHLGYHLVTHARRQYGADVWNDVINRSAKYSYWPFTFSRSMKKITGRNAKGIYQDTMTELDSLWRQQIEGLEFTAAKKLNNRKKRVWTNYKFPQTLFDGTVVVLLTGMADPHTLVQIGPDGNEKRLIQIAPTDRISVNGNKICWAVNNPDGRWCAQSFSDVVVYDVKTKQRNEITTEGKYFSPAPAPDGQRIAAVKFSPERRCSLVLLDIETGAELTQFPNPDNFFIKTPSWSNDGKRLVFIRQKYNGEALTILDIESGAQIDILPEGEEDIGYPVFYKDYVLYGSSCSGIDNIYAVHTATGARFQVTCRKFGAFYPAITNYDTLLFCDYGLKGLDIVQMPLEPDQWKALEKVERRSVKYFEPLIKQEQGRNIFAAEDIPTKEYTVENYTPLKNSLNVHSWYLLPVPPNVYCGFISNDPLNTLAIGAQITHHLGENVRKYSLSAGYAGIRPIIDTELSFGKRAALYDYNGKDSTDVWNEIGISGTLRLPVDNSAGPDITNFEIGLTAGYSKVTDHEFMRMDDRRYEEIIYFSPYLNHSRHRRQAYRDLQPVFGNDFKVSLSVGYSEFPDQVSRLSGLFRSYFPGLLKHHGISATIAIESHSDSDFGFFQSQIPFPRGYKQTYYELFKYAAVDYCLPLAYPDLALGSFLYLKRLRARLFWDFGIGDDAADLHRSIGTELMIDFTPLTLYYLEIGAGIRYSYRVEDGDRVIEFILADIAF